LFSLNDKIVNWLLEGDPSIRWQVFKYLLEKPAHIVEEERNKISKFGWGKSLLDLQDTNGTWANGLYNPKWTSTTYTLLLLKRLGLIPGNPSALKGNELLIDKGFYPDGGINFFKSLNYSETCVTGMVLMILSYFKLNTEKVHILANHLLEKQMDDGGWNCRLPLGATHSSFHTTIIALEALYEYEVSYPKHKKIISSARLIGHEFLFQHKLFKSQKTGKVIKSQFTRFSFPPRWYYDVLRAMDYFSLSNTSFNTGMRDALQIIIKKQNSDGTWNLQQKHPGKVFFEMETVGKPSRWNTLRALRILKFYSAFLL